MRKTILTAVVLLLAGLGATAETVEKVPYGDFNNWVTRNIQESRIIGGKVKKCYAIAPSCIINGDEPYSNMGGSPWASSNVMAKVVGITKVSNSVYPDKRAEGDYCAKLTTDIHNVKAIGIISLDVMVAGTMFLGEMFEPIRSTSDPYSKMEVGIPFTRRPKALQFDYKLVIPNAGIVYSSGFGKKKTTPGKDKAEVYIYLQRRWEDADGNLYAHRVGTARELFGETTDGWVNNYRLNVCYGNITNEPYYTSRMALIPEENSYYARNSVGKMVPVKEVGWDDADATPTHMLIMFSSGSGAPYTGTPGSTFWVDNVELVF